MEDTTSPGRSQQRSMEKQKTQLILCPQCTARISQDQVIREEGKLKCGVMDQYDRMEAERGNT